MAELDAKVLRWGSSVGLRIRAADARRLGLTPGEVLRVHVPDRDKPRDLSAWPEFHLPAGTVDDHDGFEAL